MAKYLTGKSITRRQIAAALCLACMQLPVHAAEGAKDSGAGKNLPAAKDGAVGKVAPGGWTQLKRDADAAYSANNYGVAERLYLQALKEAEEFGPKDIKLAQTLHSLVALYSTRGLFTKAEPLFERELRARERALGPEHPEVVATVGNLAQFYLEHSSAAKAERLTNLVLGFSDRKLKDQQMVKDQFARLAKYYDKSRDYAEAHSLLKKLEEATQRTTANQDLELAATMDALARVYQTRGKLDLAEKLFKSGLAMRERTLSPNHLALAASYENLGALATIQGKKERAQDYFKQALDVTERTLQPGRPEFFTRLESLARTQESMGKVSEAESLYKRALAVLDRSTPGSPDAGRAALALATIYFKQGQYGAAEPLFKRALKTSESANGPQHASVAPILENYADVLERLNKGSEAGRLRARARSIRGSSVVQVGNDF